MNYKGKKILVIGQARSGMAAIRLLVKLGADNITLTELKEVKNREELEQYGVKVLPQEDSLFEENWDLVIKNPGVPPVSPSSGIASIASSASISGSESSVAYAYAGIEVTKRTAASIMVTILLTFPLIFFITVSLLICLISPFCYYSID